jgi:DNA-binding IscR family transcriptional regulator
VRGPQGGHELARPPGRITLADAVIALEGGYSPIEGRDIPTSLDEPLEAEILRDVWHQVEATIGQVLESITLDDLCQRKLAHEQIVMYYI